MAWTYLNKDDFGAYGELIVAQDDTATDISSYTTKEFVFTKPDGTTTTKSASFVTDGSDGKLEYQFVDGDLDAAGLWRVHARVAKTGVDLTTEDYAFQVLT